jgi:hypothetical protein
MTGRFQIQWIDRGREPQCAPNPEYPNGIDLDETNGKLGCTVQLPYPAKRCGLYAVRCLLCGRSIIVTTAGRPDDPRSIKLACQQRLH